MKILITLLFSFLALTGYPETFEWTDFSGLNLKKSPLSLSQRESVIAENVRFGTELGSITKRDRNITYGSADASESITGMHRLYLANGTKALLVTHGNELEKGNDTTGAFTTILDLTSDGYKWQWTTWHNLALGVDGYSQPVKYDGSSASATYLGSCLATDAGSGAGPNGAYAYKVTFYTTTYEVSFDTASNTLTVTDNDIDLTMIPIGPDSYGGESVTGRKIYRTEAGGSTYLLLSNGDIANNTSTTLTDSDADGERSGAYSPNYNYAPPKGKLILVHRNRLWIANDPSYPSRIYYSEDGHPDYFLPDSYFNIRQNDGDEITFVLNLLGNRTRGKNNTIQKIYTERDDPDADWEISAPFGGNIGCQSLYSAVNSPLGIIFLSSDGIYKFNGQHSTLISDIVSPVIRDISESTYKDCWGVFHKNIYYLAYTSEATGARTNDRVLAFDLVANSYSIDKLSINAFCVFNSGTDWNVLYSGSSTNGNIYAHSGDVHEVVHNKHSDFSGTFDDMRYIPTKWGGNANSPVLELAWVETIDELTGTIDNLSGIVDRSDTNGSYISQVLYIGASTLDKAYWNETLPGTGGDVTFKFRLGATPTATTQASWSNAFSDPSGSDISSVTANDYIQYKIDLTTSNITYTPTVTTSKYTVRITYDKEAATSETSIPIHYQSGWMDLGAPGQNKVLKKVEVKHNWPDDTSGTLSLKFENWEGDTDTFDIDLLANPGEYSEYFTNGAFVGKLFRIDLTEDTVNPLRIRKVRVWFDVEPFL